MTAKRTKPPAKSRAARPGTPPIGFDAAVQTASGQPIVRLPDAASKKLPSRGQVAVSGTINGHPFETVIEPDGVFGHWIKIDRALHDSRQIEL